MSEYQYPRLKIDRVFQNLIPPLAPEEYKQLEENLLNHGCRDPICTWNGTIIDGHNRYKICIRYEIPFKTQHIALRNKKEAIAWICANQIGRRNITEETRRYLIGKRYETEKNMGIHNSGGKNQHSVTREVRPTFWGEPPSEITKNKTAKRLGEEYHLSHATIEKYGRYSRAIDYLGSKTETLIPTILSGQTKISQDNLIELAKLPAHELEGIGDQILHNDRDFVGYAASRKKLKGSSALSTVANIPQPPQIAIKNMPVFDPDAEIASLTLTIPSWISSIERTRTNADFVKNINDSMSK